MRFERCPFERLASARLDAGRGLRDFAFEGCVFRDIAGYARQLGKFMDGGEESHLPYNPDDDRDF